MLFDSSRNTSAPTPSPSGPQALIPNTDTPSDTDSDTDTDTDGTGAGAGARAGGAGDETPKLKDGLLPYNEESPSFLAYWTQYYREHSRTPELTDKLSPHLERRLVSILQIEDSSSSSSQITA